MDNYKAAVWSWSGHGTRHTEPNYTTVTAAPLYIYNAPIHTHTNIKNTLAEETHLKAVKAQLPW